MSDGAMMQANEFSRRKKPSDTAMSVAVRDIINRLGKLRNAISTGGDFFDPHIAARAIDEIDAAEERVKAGMGVTVAALAGGTGSGKSTLFNAISGLNFADAGELRPTTEQASACIWNTDAEDVLDLLEVRPSRRIDYHSLLTEGQHDLDSLVLLDLPDHDSIQVRHSVLVDQALPLVDVLIWVLDPQKYADHLIHESYLSAMRERRDHMIVVVNQIDTIPESALPALLQDVKQLLEQDGLYDIPVFPVSAITRAGLDAVIDALRQAVHGTEAVIATTQTELDAIRRRLSTSVGAREPELEGEAFERVTRSLVEATGAPSVAQSLKQAGYGFGQNAIATADQPAASMVVASRDWWLAHLTHGLPERWQNAVVASIPDAEKIRRTVGGAVRKVTIPKVGRALPLTIVALGLILGIGAFVLAALGIPDVMAARIGLAVAGVILIVGGWLIGRAVRIRTGVRAAHRYSEESYYSVRAAIGKLLVEPAAVVLKKHRQARESLQV
ncbi:MAG: GTP-binding protein [Actinomycetaceae bacterium]|nr:GTP-binding protein [Actinomycetaceae bacterium]